MNNVSSVVGFMFRLRFARWRHLSRGTKFRFVSIARLFTYRGSFFFCFDLC